MNTFSVRVFVTISLLVKNSCALVDSSCATAFQVGTGVRSSASSRLCHHQLRHVPVPTHTNFHQSQPNYFQNDYGFYDGKLRSKTIRLDKRKVSTCLFSSRFDDNKDKDPSKSDSRTKSVDKKVKLEWTPAGLRLASSMAMLGLLCFIVAALGGSGTMFSNRVLIPFDETSLPVAVVERTNTPASMDGLLASAGNIAASSQNDPGKKASDSTLGPGDTIISNADNDTKRKLRYYEAMDSNDISDVIAANENLFSFAVQSLSLRFYDNTGGIHFNQKEFYKKYWLALKAFGNRQDLVHSLASGNHAMVPVADDKSIAHLIPQKGGKAWKIVSDDGKYNIELDEDDVSPPPMGAFTSREKAVEGLKWLVSTLGDPYSKYLTREELLSELSSSGSSKNDDGFLGIGAFVEAPPSSGSSYPSSSSSSLQTGTTQAQSPRLKKVAMCEYGNLVSFLSTECASPTAALDTRLTGPMSVLGPVQLSSSSMAAATGITASSNYNNHSGMLSITRASNLPLVTAVEPNSPAERSGLVVGDRVAGVGSVSFLGMDRQEIKYALDTKYSGADNYFGFPELTIAKPLFFTTTTPAEESSLINDEPAQRSDSTLKPLLVGYRSSRVKMVTATLEPFQVYNPAFTFSPTDAAPLSAAFADLSSGETDTSVAKPSFFSGGNKACYWQLLSSTDSIFRQNVQQPDSKPVGYIRLTRFSRSSTDGYLDAVENLERLGAGSYIIDVRNNYGGVVQEAMLTASTLFRDPGTVLCWTLDRYVLCHKRVCGVLWARLFFSYLSL
jgi:hypothetical protein